MATDPACLHALEQLTTVLDRRGVMSAVIGGMALQLLQPLATVRVTHDIDLALLVESFDEYEEIRSELAATGWTPEPEEHRLRSPEGCLVDLLPYPRKDVVGDRVILPRSKTPLNVAGMVEAIAAGRPVFIGAANRIQVNVAPIEHVALLKMVAWAERGATRDGWDLIRIARTYGEDRTDDMVRLIGSGEAPSALHARALMLGRALTPLLSSSAAEAVSRCMALLAAPYGPAISRIWVEWARDREDEDRFRDEVGWIAEGLRAGLGRGT